MAQQTTTRGTDRIKGALEKEGPLLSIYFTAGYPALEDTLPILRQLQASGVDMIEVGLPFSDPLADGPTIQESSTAALKNGMTTARLFEQLKGVRQEIRVPLILMGYFNPVLQYGVEAFCKQCAETGIDGLILPDLPLEIYEREYREILERYGLKMIFLITPQTSVARIRQIDAASDAFIYMVSSASTTGAREGFDPVQLEYFRRVAAMDLKNPRIVGFGISNADTFGQATAHAKGAIIGSAFIRELSAQGVEGIPSFIKNIRP
jgi:tryptophan synthase alpha chain